MAMLGSLIIPWLGPKDTEPRATSVPKVKLGHIDSVCYRVLIFRKLSYPSNGYIGFPYHPLVRPKRHGTTCAISPKGEARTHGPRAPSVPKAKLGYSDRVHHRSQRRSQDTRTAFTIGPKGEARIFRLPLDSIGVLYTLQGGGEQGVGGGGDRANNQRQLRTR